MFSVKLMNQVSTGEPTNIYQSFEPPTFEFHLLAHARMRNPKWNECDTAMANSGRQLRFALEPCGWGILGFCRAASPMFSFLWARSFWHGYIKHLI